MTAKLWPAAVWQRAIFAMQNDEMCAIDGHLFWLDKHIDMCIIVYNNTATRERGHKDAGNFHKDQSFGAKIL